MDKESTFQTDQASEIEEPKVQADLIELKGQADQELKGQGDQEPEGQGDQVPNVEMEQEPQGQVDQELEGEADQASKSQMDLKHKSQADQEPKDQGDQKPKGQTVQVPNSKMEQEPQGQVDQEPKGEADQVPKRQADQKPKGEADQVTKGQADQEPKGEADQAPKGQVDQKPKGQADQEFKGEVDQKPKGPADQVPNVEMDQEPKGQVDQGSKEDQDSTDDETDSESSDMDIDEGSSYHTHAVQNPRIRTRKIFPMNEEYRDIIEEDYMYLSVSMRQNIKRLINHLVSKNVITSEEQEDIMDEASSTLRSQTLLDYMIKLDNRAFNDFYDGALGSHMWVVADILKPEKGPHMPAEEDIEEFLPDNWPTNSHITGIMNPAQMQLIKVEQKHAKMVRLYEDCTKDESPVYDMKTKVRGRMLMIVNKNFTNSEVFPEKDGVLYDKNGLEQLFHQLNFETDVHENQTAAQMMNLVTADSKKELSKYNCFFLIILSYSSACDKKYVCGIDATGGKSKEKDGVVDIQDIKIILSNTPALVNKPKVIIIDAPKPSRNNKYGLDVSRIAATSNKFKAALAPHSMEISTHDFPKMSRKSEKILAIPDLPPLPIGIPTHLVSERSMKSKNILPGSYKHSIDVCSIAATSSKKALAPHSMEISTLDFPKMSLKSEKILAIPEIPNILSKMDSIKKSTSLQFERSNADFPEMYKIMEPKDLIQNYSPFRYQLDGLGGEMTAPAMGDFFDIFFCSGDYVDFENKRVGSWFMQAFIYVMTTYSFQVDMATIIAKVNELTGLSDVDNHRGREHKGKRDKPVCIPESTLAKKLYLFPGWH